MKTFTHVPRSTNDRGWLGSSKTYYESQCGMTQLTWYHNLALLEKIDDPETRIWYAKKTIEYGWSRNILALQIESKLHKRQGKAVSNFMETLPPPDSDMATQVFKDPYLFDFLGIADERREREVERMLSFHSMEALFNG